MTSLRTGTASCALCASLLALIAPAHGEEDFRLSAPIACQLGAGCIIQNYVDHGSSTGARDYHCGSLTYHAHNGTDFRVQDMRAQRAGVDVLAAAEGAVLRVRDGVADLGADGIAQSRAEGRECGNGLVISHAGGWQTQYCHMALGSIRVKPGDQVSAGQAIGRVGLSGSTEYPHVHLTVRKNDRVVDPFAFGAPEGACDGGVSLWDPSLQAKLNYRERTVFNAGFTSRTPVTMAMIESGEADEAPRRADAAVLAAFVRTVGLKAGDVQRLRIEAPDHRVIADHTAQPIDRNKAQVMMFVGVRRPPEGWPEGAYAAHYSVSHDGQMVAERRFSLNF